MSFEFKLLVFWDVINGDNGDRHFAGERSSKDEEGDDACSEGKSSTGFRLESSVIADLRLNDEVLDCNVGRSSAELIRLLTKGVVIIPIPS